MRSFREFLIESHKTYTFRVKVAGELTNEQVGKLEDHFERWGLESLSKPKRTPIQEHPQDFPEVTNSEISIMELIVNYPATPRDILECVHSALGIPVDHIRVYNEHDPHETDREAEVKAEDDEYEVQLTAPYPKTKSEGFGDKYNKQFLKGLEKMPKMKIAGGNTSKAQTSNELPQGKSSPVGSNKVKMPTPRSSAR